MLHGSMALLMLLTSFTGIDAMRVLITGAGGRTGKAVFQTLQKDFPDSVMPVGLVRSKKARKTLIKAGASPEQIVSADVTSAEAMSGAMAGCDAVVLCTSAVPKINIRSLASVMFKKTVLRRKEAGRPTFRFAEGGTPQEVDWLGARLQIDAAKAAGVKKFVFISSMGGTDPDNFLNTIGRQEDGTGGDILLWKRKAERYLISSGLDYTIIHPGGLVDECPGARELVVGVDDEMLQQATNRQVPRNDVARVACAALTNPAASNLSFDLASKPVGQGKPTADLASLFKDGKSCAYSEPPIEPPPLPKLAGSS